MSKHFTLVLLCIIFSNTTAKADIYMDCLAAIKRSDTAEVERLAQKIMDYVQIFQPPAQALEIGSQCVSSAKGKEYTFDENSKQFLSREQLEENAAAQIEENRLAEEKRVEDQRREAARIQQENENQRLEAEAQALKEAQTMEVLLAVKDACKELYFDDPSQALTNNICLDVFLETGLPKEE
jgi:hypothetical protein